MGGTYTPRGLTPSIHLTCTLFLLTSPTVFAQEHAVVPSCSTNAAGSTSCNIGINPVPTLGPVLDGGYQWLSQETVTYTIFGVPIIESTPVFTATETNFLDVSTQTTVNLAGVTATNIETQYVSFITATPSLNGAAAAAVIAGVVVAPALVASLQTIADAAAGKTLQQISDEIKDAFGIKKTTLTPGDLQNLAKYLFAAIGGGVVAGIALKPINIPPFWTGTTIAADGPNLMTSSSSSSSSSSQQNSGTAAPVGSASTESIVTAIVKYPYENWQALLAIPFPTATISELPSNTPTASCHPSNIGVDPGIANELALAFCTGSSLDFTKSESEDVFGSNLNPPVSITSGVFIHFDYTHADGNCVLGCWESYNQMIKSCQYDSHGVYGIASLADACGTYAMTISSGSTAPQPTPSTRPEVVRTCVDHSVYVSFPRDRALDVIGKFCSSGITLAVAAQAESRQYKYSDVTMNLAMGWSLTGQTGCAPFSTSQVSQADCIKYFTDAVDLCDTDNGYTKYGSKPLSWSSSIGCIDISIYGTGAS